MAMMPVESLCWYLAPSKPSAHGVLIDRKKRTEQTEVFFDLKHVKYFREEKVLGVERESTGG